MSNESVLEPRMELAISSGATPPATAAAFRLWAAVKQARALDAQLLLLVLQGGDPLDQAMEARATLAGRVLERRMSAERREVQVRLATESLIP